MLVTDEAMARAEIERLVAALRRPPLRIAAALLDSLGDSDSPRGILALARLPRGGVDRLPERGVLGVLFLDGVQDPGNVGALARVAEAFGVDALALGPGSAHPNHPRALRASAGSLLRLPAVGPVTVEALDRRLGAAAPWAALAAHGGVPIDRVGPRVGNWVLAVGAEGAGLSAAVEARVDERWTIPLAGRVESLNVAVAAAVALFALAGARR